MNSNLQTDLLEVAVLTFEELGLMCPQGADEDGAPFDGPCVATSVDFTGVLSGRLVVAAYGDVASSLAANMLGEDEAPSGEGQLDALGEAANVVCGNLLPRAAGYKEVFSIAGPKPAVLEASGETASAEARLTLDEGAVLVRLYLDDAAKGLPA